MATSENVDSQLKPFEIDENRLQDGTKEGRDREQAAGAYGFVYEVKVDGVNRIAKKPHAYFLKRAREAEKKAIVLSFKRECVVLSKLRHPNIVQFIGVTYENKEKDNISMIMEKMECDLANFLEDTEKISLATKLFILQDVSFGLVYLHESNPPILHRDLTARNILLTRSLRAKIADVGVAKLMDPATMAAARHTTAPGQANYMPPESLKERAKYTLKLDSFSFGHLSLHTMLEDFPKVYNITVTPAIEKEGIIEKLRRQNSLDLIGEDHLMCPLITQCLHDNPDKRPTAREVNDRINVLVDRGSYLSVAEEGENAGLVKEINWLTEELELLSVKKSKTEDNLLQLQKEVEHNKAQYDSDKKDLQKEVDEAIEDNEKLRLDCATAHNEKESVLKEFDQERKRSEDTLTSIQNGLKAKYQELQQLLMKERHTWAKKEQMYASWQRNLKTQLDGEKLGYSSEITKLSRELSYKDQALHTYERELLYAKDQLQRVENQLAQTESELKDGQIDDVGLCDYRSAYQRLLLERDEIEQQRKEYELKYSDLMDAYSKLHQLALDHNLIVPKREKHARYQSPYTSEYISVPAEHNLSISHYDPGLVQGHSKRAATEFVSGRGPPGNQLQQPMLYADPHPGPQNAYSRSRQDIHNPANVRHHQEREDEFIGIHHDNSEATAYVEGRAIETSLVPVDDSRQLDSNLICPLCGKQFRIGQIQNYRQHVDNCTR